VLIFIKLNIVIVFPAKYQISIKNQPFEIQRSLLLPDFYHIFMGSIIVISLVISRVR